MGNLDPKLPLGTASGPARRRMPFSGAGSGNSTPGIVREIGCCGGVAGTIAFIGRIVPGVSKNTQRRNAIAAFSTIIGAMMLARTVDDPQFSDEILETAARTVAGIGKAGSAGA